MYTYMYVYMYVHSEDASVHVLVLFMCMRLYGTLLQKMTLKAVQTVAKITPTMTSAHGVYTYVHKCVLRRVPP